MRGRDGAVARRHHTRRRRTRARHSPTRARARRPSRCASATILGTVDEQFDAARAEEYLDAIGETLPVYRDEKIAHPGWLLRRANRILSRNVEMGPWMHVESNVQQLGLVHDGEAVSTRGRVTDVFERGGHRFVTIDVVVLCVRPPRGARRAHCDLRTPSRRSIGKEIRRGHYAVAKHLRDEALR